MLSVLQIKDNGGLKPFRRFWHNLTQPAVSAYMVPAENIHYLKIIGELRRGKPDWRMIRAYSLDCSERVLMPAGVTPPPDSGVRRFEPHVFKRKMLENMALDILNRSQKRPELRRAAVYGQDNEIIAMLPRLIQCTGEVRVITRRGYAIADVIEEFRARTGAAISVSNEFDAAGFDLLLAPAGGAAVFRVSENMIVLSPDRPSVPVNLWIKEARPPLPAILESEYDGRYDITEFTGAFYEVGEIRSLGRLSPECALTESGELTAEEAAQIIGR